MEKILYISSVVKGGVCGCGLRCLFLVPRFTRIDSCVLESTLLPHLPHLELSRAYP